MHGGEFKHYRNYKKDQIEVLVLKNIIESRNSIDGLKRRVDINKKELVKLEGGLEGYI